MLLSPLSAYAFCRSKRLRSHFDEVDEENININHLFIVRVLGGCGSSPLSDCKTIFVLQPGLISNFKLSADKKRQTIIYMRIHNGMLIKIRRVRISSSTLYIFLYRYGSGQFARVSEFFRPIKYRGPPIYLHLFLTSIVLF